MKRVIKHAVISVVLFGLFFLCLIGVSYCVYPKLHTLDTNQEKKTVYYEQRRLAINAIWEAGIWDCDSIVLLGGSNVGQGFRPEFIEPLVPGVRVHNLALNGPSIGEIRTVVDLVQRASRAPSGRSPIFVVGFWFGTFVDNKQLEDFRIKWAHLKGEEPGPPPWLEKELERCWLYRFNDGRVEPAFPTGLMTYMLTTTRPYLFAETTKLHATHWLRERAVPFGLASLQDGRLAVEILSAPEPPPVFLWPHADLANYVNQYMGNDQGRFEEEQFDELSGLCQDIIAADGTLILVDMPLAEWYRYNNPFQERFETLLRQHMEPFLGSGCVEYIEMVDAPLKFADWAHPLPNSAREWSETFGARLAEVLAKRTPESGV